MDILISGASVAGPCIAHWLQRYGHRTTVVERAPSLRGGGYAVDFRGRVHLTTLERMGLLDEVRRRTTGLGDIAIVDARGATVATMPAAIVSGDVEILRGDLAQVLYDATRDGTEYLFGDSIAGIEQDEAGVDVTFERAGPRRFELVVGADGVHSNVRRLVFGDDPAHRRALGVYAGIFTAPNELGLNGTGVMYNEPGRVATVGAPHGGDAIVSLFFGAGGVSYDHRDVDQQRRIVAEAFAGAGWQVPRLLELMESAADFYFDGTLQIRLDRWSRGRVVLLGDAGYAGGPGGNGTGLALVGAHILAGELELAGGEHRVAFRRYEERMRPYVAAGQKQAAGSPEFLVPSSWKKINQRNRFFRSVRYVPPVKHLFTWLATRTATAIRLPSYPTPAR
jgi:2-polyprenyl-6-methoxyphenol hydroxylase-like FAD-dependent oxidoreductase